MLSDSSELSQLSELIELPEVFSSMEKALLHQALRLGDLLLELRFVSRSSETSGTSQSSISYCPAFPDVPSSQFSGVQDFTQKALENLQTAHNAILMSHVKQAIQANKHQSPDPPMKVGDLAYLSTKDLNLPKG